MARNDNFGKWKTHTVGREIWWENWKRGKNKHSRTGFMAKKWKKRGKWEKKTLFRKENNEKNKIKTLFDMEYSKKHWKSWKMRNAHCRTWNMARKMKNVKNEMQTLFDLEYGEKHWKGWKMRNAHCMMWNMASNTEKREKWEKHSRTWIMARNTEKGGKWEMHTVGPGLWQEIDNFGKWETHTVGCEILCGKLKKLEKEKNTL